MGSIVTTLDVNAEGAIGAVDELAAAAERLDAAWGALEDKLDKPLGAGGADKMASQWDAAFRQIQAGADKLQESLARLGDLGKVGDSGAAGLAKIADAEKAAAAQADAMAASLAKADDTLKGLGTTSDTSAAGVERLSAASQKASESAAGLRDTSAGAADGIKGLGAGADMSAAQMAEFNKVMRDSAALQADTAKVSADASLAMARASKVQADAKTSLATTSVEQDAAMAQSAKASKAAQEDAAASAEASAKKHEMLALGIAAVAGYGIDMAAKLQTSVTRLYTSAGESKGNLGMISQGILGMSGPTATSQAQLGQGAYYVESAGIHGQSALNVLRAVAQGAYAEGAPLADVANAATSIINAYGIKPTGTAATSVVNQMLTAVGQGKMTMAGLSSALPAVLAPAATAGISLPQVLGSVASMTATGMSPDQATQDIRHAITSMQKPTNVQSAELQMLGISPVQLAHDLGKQGLTGTIQEVDSAIQKHMGPGGMVLLDTMNQSKLAVQSANEEIAAMPPAIQGMAKAYMDGTVSAKQFNQEIFSGSESARDKALLSQFQTTASNALGFSSIVKSGLGDKQTVTAALNEALGGQTGAQVAMMLGGTHLGTTAADVNRVADASKHAGDNIQGWAEVQKNLNYQLASFRYSAEAAATSAGQVLLPAATTALHGLSAVAGFFAAHPDVTKPLAEAGGILGAGYALSKVASPVTTGLRTVGTIAEKLNIPGLDKLAGIGQNTGLAGAASGLQGAAGSLEGAAGSLEGAAGSLKAASTGSAAAGEGAAAAEGAGAAAGGEAATAEAAGAATAASRLPKAGVTGLIAAVVGAQVLGSISSGPGGKNWWENPFGMPGPSDKASSGNWLTSFSPYERLITGNWAHEGGPAPAGTMPGAVAAASRFSGGYVPPASTPASAAGPSGSVADLLGAGGHPGTVEIKPKIVPPDASSLAGFSAMLSQAMHLQPVKVPPPDLSGLASARGTATADGAALSAGFASGITSGTAAADAAAAAVANSAAAAMRVSLKISSPSQVTAQIGGQYVSGLIQGLEGGQSNLQNAVTALYGALSNPDATNTIQQTIQQLQTDVSGDTGLVKWLTKEQGKLTTLANKQGALMTQISDAQQTASSVISGASVVGASGYVPAVVQAGGYQSAQGAVNGLQMMLSDTQAFASALTKLKGEGLNATSLSQLAQAGVSAGLPAAQGLASGGKAAVQQVNALEAQIIKASQQIGGVGGTAMYQAGLAVTNGLASGLKAQLKQVDAEMTKIADQIIATVQHKLGTSSKSSSSAASAAASSGTVAGVVSAAGGGKAADEAASGLARAGAAGTAAAGGLDQVAGAASGAAGALGKLAGLAAPSGSTGSGYGGGGYGGAPAPAPVHVTHVHNVHIDGQQVATSVQSHVLEWSNNNWQAGLVPAGKHA